MTSFERQRSFEHVGQMTAAMRAGAHARAVQHGKKLLRVGVVQEGRVRAERTMKIPVHVSVGTSEENTFVLGGSAHAKTFRLFEHIDDGYCLNLTDDMQGRVALRDGLFELDELRAGAHRASDGLHRVPLTDEARGRITLGDVSFLFHFVVPLPVVPKAVLPAAVLRNSASVDWSSTICAAISFLFHFMLLGAVYSDWLDPVIDDEASAAGLIDSLRNLPPPPAIEDKLAKDEPPERAYKDPLPSSKERSKVPPGKSARPSGGPSAIRAHDSALSDQLAQIDAAILGFLTASHPATRNVLKQSPVAWGALDEAAVSHAGVASGSEPRLPSGGGAIRAGAAIDFRSSGTTSRGSEGSGHAVAVRGPSSVTTLPLITTGGVVSNAASVVAGMRAGFRACYQRGLAENPDASGSIKLTIRVGPGGEVLGVNASASGNLPAGVIGCVQARARAAQFDAPDGGFAVIAVPVTFVRQ